MDRRTNPEVIFESGLSRRDWLIFCGAGLSGASSLVGLVSGCSRSLHTGVTSRERAVLLKERQTLPIVQWNPRDPRDPRNTDSVLRKKARSSLALSMQWKKRIDEMMRATLRESGGVGLAAPQVDISRRVALVQLQSGEKPILICLDPEIVRYSKETIDDYEACLSIKGYGGLVRRSAEVDVVYYDLQGKKKTIASKGWEARIFQHELDHLVGKLYLDRLIGDLLPIDEMRRRRNLRKRRTSNNLESSSIGLRIRAGYEAADPIFPSATASGEGWICYL